MKHLLAIVFLIPLSLSAEISKLEYHGFTLWFDCKAKVAIRFQYTLDRDDGAIRRIHKYYHDPILAPYCQQLETLSYNKNKNIEGYDRGHLVPYNHMDQSLIASHQTNYMTNVLSIEERQVRDSEFVDDFVNNGGNATQAAKTVGVSDGSASTVGHRMKNRLINNYRSGPEKKP